MDTITSPRSPLKSVLFIVGVTSSLAIAFAYTAGWLSPRRVTPDKLVAALAGPGGPALGHRRNHGKGICFTGEFLSNGNGEWLSTAQVFQRGTYQAIGRFNTGSPDPNSSDPMAQVRGFGTQITTPDGQQWRGAAINAPFFVAKTPEDFYTLISAGKSGDPNAGRNYIASHPEASAFINWVKGHARTESWSEERFNSLDSFTLTDASGQKHVVRWSFIPEAKRVELTSEALAKHSPDFLEQDIVQRAATGPLHWQLVLTIANPGDPTADPTKTWPSNRKAISVGTLTVLHVEPEANGPCRDINFDPTVLPKGISTSDDPFPSARSAAYRVSYDSRMSEESHYPHTNAGAKQ